MNGDASKQLYNIFTRNKKASADNGNDNFFTKTWKSLENAFGTTGASAVSAIDSARENRKTQERLNKWNDSIKNIANEAGYEDLSSFYDAKNAAEKDIFGKYGFDIDDYNSKISGFAESDPLNENKPAERIALEQARADVIARMNPEDAAKIRGFDDTASKFSERAKANAQEGREASAKWNDYRKNSYVGQKVNQDRGKFAGSAINTLNTMTDVLLPGAGIALNSVQGAAGGVADELEQNGLENFDAERAKQNAIAGAASGAVAGGVSRGMGKLASSTEPILKGRGLLSKTGNAVLGLDRKLLNAAPVKSNSVLGQAANSAFQGALRGGVAGAAGGATGAGISAAMNGQDVGESIKQGFMQGAQQGSFAGGIIGGVAGAGNAVRNRITGNEMLDTTTPNEVQRLRQPEVQEAENPYNLAYGESDLSNETNRGVLANSLKRWGNALEGAQSNATRPALKDVGIKSAGEVIDNVRKKTGLTNLERQASFAKEITGGPDSLLDNIQRNAFSASEDGKPFRVDTTPVLEEVDSIVGKYADSNTFSGRNGKQEFINNIKADINNGDADVLSIASRMKRIASDLRGKGVGQVPAKDAAQASIYTEIANKLEDLSYKQIPSENIDSMFDTAIYEMKGRAYQAKMNGNKSAEKAWNKAAESLDAQPRTAKDFRSWKKDFVDVSNIDRLTAPAENGAAAQMTRAGGFRRLGDVLLARPINAGASKLGGFINKAADFIGSDGTGRTPTPTTPTITPETTIYNRLYDVIGRQEGLSNAEQARTADYLVNATNEAKGTGTSGLESLIGGGYSGTTPTSTYNSVGATTIGAGGSNTGYFQPTGDYWTDILASAMSSAINANDVAAFASLYGMYQDSLSNLQKQQTSTSNQKITATQQRANAAMDSLERLANMTPDLGYNLSNIPLVGGIATLGGNAYEGEANSLAQQIGYMVSGANIKEEEARNIGKAYVPQPWDSEQTRQDKLRRAYNIIRQYQNGYATEENLS